MSTLRHVFAENALELHRHGLCVLPIAPDRTPRVRGFQKWKRGPSLQTLTKWIGEYGNSNIAIIPELSDVIVADSDDLSQDADIEKLLGKTPLCVRTSRGRHRYYRQTSVRLPSDLRKGGLNVDLKMGNSLVIAPPSIHELGVVYALDGCDWSAKKDLPPINADALKCFLERSRDATCIRRNWHLRDGSRVQWLNDRLCSDAPYCETLDEVLDKACTLCAELEENGFPPLDHSEVLKTATKVWRDVAAGNIQPRSQWRGSARSIRSAIDHLCHLDKRGADAVVLLLKLQAEHMARCRRGETFCITPVAMAEHQVIPQWTRERYEKARNLLVKAGWVTVVSAFKQTRGGRKPAQYALAGTKAARLGAGGAGG